MLRKNLLAIFSLASLALPFCASAEGIVIPHQYAWSDNVGYINFENVIVDDTELSGYAWSANTGWIKFDPTNGGVSHDGNGNLSGSAWGTGLGWIDFDNVSINTSTGQFSGTATGALAGTITFDCPTYCDVQTDWRPATPGGGGGGGGSAPTIPEVTSGQWIDPSPDGIIDIVDISIMLYYWGGKPPFKNPNVDVNNDGQVNSVDFSILLYYWGDTVGSRVRFRK